MVVPKMGVPRVFQNQGVLDGAKHFTLLNCAVGGEANTAPNVESGSKRKKDTDSKDFLIL